MEKLHFSSDYMKGAHPLVLQALVDTNEEATPGYGTDDYCLRAEEKILTACSCPDGEVFFLTGGTQTNAVVIDGFLRPYEGVIAADTGHVAVHEAGAIEFGGHKVLTVPQEQGKLTPEALTALLTAFHADDNRAHMVRPGMVYISHPTEYGTLYSKAELAALSEICREFGIPLYLDGARLAYALATPENDVTLADLAALTDAFYIGGTKCGCLFGEALVFPKKNTIPHFYTLIKTHGAMLAKGRLLGVQFDALFTGGLYDRIGAPALRSADRIRKALAAKGIPMPIPSPTNQVFFVLDHARIEQLKEQAEYGFMEPLDEGRSLIRFAPSWATADEETDALVRVIEQL